MVVNKSKAAFRTIAEVAEELGVATHVLRFWETKFPQIKPMKRNGGRRYYRPDDVKLVSIIKDYLYEKRYTIEGVQHDKMVKTQVEPETVYKEIKNYIELVKTLVRGTDLPAKEDMLDSPITNTLF